MPKRVVAPKKKIAKKKRPLNAYFKAMMKAKNSSPPAESFEYNGNTYVKDFVLPPNAKPGQQPLLVYKKQV